MSDELKPTEEVDSVSEVVVDVDSLRELTRLIMFSAGAQGLRSGYNLDYLVDRACAVASECLKRLDPLCVAMEFAYRYGGALNLCGNEDAVKNYVAEAEKFTLHERHQQVHELVDKIVGPSSLNYVDPSQVVEEVVEEEKRSEPTEDELAAQKQERQANTPVVDLKITKPQKKALVGAGLLTALDVLNRHKEGTLKDINGFTEATEAHIVKVIEAI